MARLDDATHVLVDGVRYKNALARLYRRDDLSDIMPVYHATRFAELKEAGPMLARLDGCTLINEARSDPELLEAVSFIEARTDAGTALPSDDVADHLRPMITVISRSAPWPQLFRFADPQVLRFWLRSYGEFAPTELFGPITRWWVAHPPALWLEEDHTPHWLDFVIEPGDREPHDAPHLVTVEPEDGGPSVTRLWLTENNEAALQAARTDQLKRRLHAFLARDHRKAWARTPPAQRGRWMEARLLDARAFGAASDYHYALWMELALEHGDTWASAPDGLLARWRDADPTRAEWGAQQQLDALDSSLSVSSTDSQRPQEEHS